MKGDRKLRLVSPPGGGAPEGGADELVGSLRAAYGLGAPLPDDAHEAILAAALGDEVAGAAREPVVAPRVETEETAELDVDAQERRQADQLREALAGRALDPATDPKTAALVALAVALAAAHRPAPIAQLSHQSILNRTLGRLKSRRRLQAVSGVLLATAAAAAAVFGLRVQSERAPAASEVAAPTAIVASTMSLAVSRSTQELFDAEVPFERTGGTSERVDRIARARNSDLRDNRFARWGIK